MRVREHSNIEKCNEKCNEKFKYYKMLSKEVITSNKELNKKYEEEIINILEKKNNLSLEEIIRDIENTNPFESYGYKRRKDYREKDRKSLKEQEKVHNCFCSVTNGRKDNSLETMIQRNIVLSRNYDNIIGIPIYYEFVCDKPKSGAIDLITYNKSENILYLIELKKCNAKLEPIKSNEKESIETFLRASFEISTYYSFFTHLIEEEKYKKKVEDAFEIVSGEKINLDTVDIRKAILAPKRLYDDIYSNELKKLQKNFECFVIELNNNIKDLSKYEINTKEKLFNIEKYNSYNN